MDNLAWLAILRQIPEEKQNQFSLLTSAGTEIAVQRFMRLENDFVVVKGRLAGSQEAGRVFFVPYVHIDFIGTLHPIKDAEYEDLFGSLTIAPAAPTVAAPAVEQVPVPPPAPVVVPVAPAAASSGILTKPTENNTPPPRSTLRSEVLERFRARPVGPASSPTLPNPRET